MNIFMDIESNMIVKSDYRFLLKKNKKLIESLILFYSYNNFFNILTLIFYIINIKNYFSHLDNDKSYSNPL